MRPASRPLCSRTVCRSARIWHGWNWSVSALITGTELTAAISSMPLLAVRAPDDRRDLAGHHPGDVGDRLALADAGQAPVDDHGLPAEFDDPDGEGQLGAQGGLVEEQGDGLRAGERAEPVPVGLHLVGAVEDGEQLVGSEVVVAQEVPRHGRTPRPGPRPAAGRPRRRLRLGDDQRRHQAHRVRPDGVDQQPALAGRLLDGRARGSPASATPSQSPLPRARR